MKKNFEIEIRWRAFPLHPDTPEEGLTLEELFRGRNIDISQMLSRLKQVADELGLPWGERKKTCNSRLAQELGKWAESKGQGDKFHDAVFRAYFVAGKNIGKMDVGLSLAKSVGLPEEEAKEVLQSRAFRKAVDEDWSLSYRMGITAVPTFVIDGQAVVGAQPYEVLEKFLKECRVLRRDRSRL
ncbi:MAG: DsbA family oxidoreductase [Deltaproteobacteria bacterium]|nr:DsbA family oxidoreductase [Deltaproteobacteria bacterium]